MRRFARGVSICSSTCGRCRSMRRERRAATGICVLLLFGLEGRAPAGQAAGAEQEFRRGLTALHNFEYEEANEAFQQARTLDQGFVMAYWGEAMTFDQTLWRHENVEAARQALGRLGSTPAERR